MGGSGSGKGKGKGSKKSSKGSSAIDFSANFLADFGPYGEFSLDVPNDGTMSWELELDHLDALGEMLGLNITSLNYHLHTEWGSKEDYMIGADNCTTAATGGHFDPYFACGPASAVPADQCNTIGKPTTEYMCNTTIYWEEEKYDQCEVGDLSGKAGSIEVEHGMAHGGLDPDYLPALQYHYANVTDGSNPPAQFASIVVHLIGLTPPTDRIICAKLDMAAEEETSETKTTTKTTKSSSSGGKGKGKGKGKSSRGWEASWSPP